MMQQISIVIDDPDGLAALDGNLIWLKIPAALGYLVGRLAGGFPARAADKNHHG
jgi:hypothetical protein